MRTGQRGGTEPGRTAARFVREFMGRGIGHRLLWAARIFLWLLLLGAALVGIAVMAGDFFEQAGWSRSTGGEMTSFTEREFKEAALRFSGRTEESGTSGGLNRGEDAT